MSRLASQFHGMPPELSRKAKKADTGDSTLEINLMKQSQKSFM